MSGGAKPISYEEHQRRLKIWNDNQDLTLAKIAEKMGLKLPCVRAWAIKSELMR